MVTIKSFTSLEQSKKLAEILPLDSADIYWRSLNLNGYISWTSHIKRLEPPIYDFEHYAPCWSLAALLEQLPYELCDDDGNSLYLEINKEGDVYQLAYIDTSGLTDNIYPDMCEHFVDACVDMIEKLHELKLI